MEEDLRRRWHRLGVAVILLLGSVLASAAPTTFVNGVAGDAQGVTNLYSASTAPSMAYLVKGPPYFPWNGLPYWQDDAKSIAFTDPFTSTTLAGNCSLPTPGSGGTAGVQVGAPPGFSNPGWLSLTSYPTNVSSHGSWRACSSYAATAWQSNVYMEASVVVSPVGSDFTNSTYMIGLMDNIVALPGNCAMWRARPDWSTNWIITVRSGFTTLLNTTSSFPCTINTRENLALSGTTNTINFYTNGNLCLSYSGQTPGGAQMSPVMTSLSTYGNASGTGNRLFVDWVKLIYQ